MKEINNIRRAGKTNTWAGIYEKKWEDWAEAQKRKPVYEIICKSENAILKKSPSQET